MIDAPDLAWLIIGGPGFTRKNLRMSVAAFRKMCAAGVGYIMLSVSGYDDDPRAVWEIPEAAAYFRDWARQADIRSAEDATAAGLSPDSIHVLDRCRAFDLLN